MTKTTTQGERLARIEAILEGNGHSANQVIARLDELDRNWNEKFDGLDSKWTAKFDHLDEMVRTDVADLAAIKNKGLGALGVASVVFTFIGAVIMAAWDKVTSAIFS